MSYTAVVLNAESKAKLLKYFDSGVPLDWERVCHHMTINLGGAENGPAAGLVGQEFEIVVKSFAEDKRVFAVGVESECPSNNKIKHITVAVNVNGGGKAKHSNELTIWTPLVQPLVLRGTVEVVQ
jgi:hypothetical protein